VVRRDIDSTAAVAQQTETDAQERTTQQAEVPETMSPLHHCPVCDDSANAEQPTLIPS
jgi:hypothetical protein